VAADTVLVIDDSPTILKVVQLVLSKAGFKVHTAEDGEQGIAKALAEKPSIILLDFVMPRMNGYQVCRALADHESLKDIPVVLMSAKGDQVGERFVKVMGIVDYITKPFSPDAITAVVQHTIAKYKDRPAGEPSTDEDNWATPGPTDETTGPGVDVTAMRPMPRSPMSDALNAFRDALAEVLEGDDPMSADLVDRLKSRLDDAALERLVEPLLRAGGGSADGQLVGDLRAVPVAEVLSLLGDQRQWGVLKVNRAPEEAEVSIVFKAGRIELCHSEGLGEEFLVGRYLVDQGAMSRQDLDLFLRSRSGEGAGARPIGEQLIKLGYVGESDLQAALVRQTQEKLYEVLRWPAGRFVFTATRELPPLALEAALELPVDGVLMEGFRRIDEWHLIEREIDDFDAVYLRNEEAVQNVGKARLTREELQILDLVNGKSSVKDIVRQSRMGSFEVSKMLFRLLSIKVIRRRVSPIAV
jgi:CheY-like chemotaxis protein